MIRLHYSNRMENLVAPLAEAVAAQQRLRPLERIHIVVPNRVVEEFVKLRLAEKIGVAANLEFPFLRRYLARVVQAANPGLGILEFEELQVLLFESLRRAIAGGAAEIRAVRDYAETAADRGRGTADTELRLFQLAGQTARLFREYSITRRPMLHRWQTGESLASSPFEATEQWQRHLWRSLFGADHAVRPEWLTGAEHQWMLLPDGFDATGAGPLKAALSPVLHVFGLAYVGPAFAGMFARLGAVVELHIYALNPCLEFWEDVEHPSGVARESWVRRRERLDSAQLQDASDPFALDVTGDNPALRLWARPGREYIRLLNELTDCDFDPHFAHPANSAAPTLLQRLQESVLIREAERAPKPAGHAADADASIRFLACAGIRREAEIAADTIWSLVQHPAGAALRFHEIAVVVPDRALDEYVPHLETAFAQSHQIPVEVVNRRFATESRVAEAIGLLLRLPLGRFTRDELLRLLTHPAIVPADFAIDRDRRPDRWAQWCDELGVYFGADRDDLAGTYIPEEVFHWDQALKRLALGTFMTGEPSRDSRFFRAPDSREYLPYEVAPDEATAVASLVRLARRMLSDARELRAQRLTLADWGKRLSDFVLGYVNAPNLIDERIRDYCVSAIESIAAPAIRSEPVPYLVACEFALACIAEVEARRGRYGGRGVAIGSLAALRSIPFRVIFALGLNEADFPERPGFDPLDLRLARRSAGDVTPTERDRYLFLETLLAARERIFLSYVSRDSRTGDRLEPSAVIRELQFILRGYLDEDAVKGLTVEHPVSRYDLRYFPDLDPEPAQPAAELVSYDRDARRGARMTALRQDLIEHCGDAPLPGRDEPMVDRLAPEVRQRLYDGLRLPELAPHSADARDATELSLPLAALRKFLECPIQGAARYALGMLEDDEGAAEDQEDEPLAQSVLDRTVLLRDALWRSRGDREAALAGYAELVKIAQVHGHAPVGLFAEAAEKADRARLGAWIDQTRAAGGCELADWQEVRIGHAGEFARADRILDDLMVDVSVPHPDGGPRLRRARLHGNVGFMSPGLDASLRFVLRGEPKAKDFLYLFISAIALAATGVAGREFRAIVVGSDGEEGKTFEKRLRLPEPERARQYLAALAADLLSGDNHYFLPIEAVEEFWRKWKGIGKRKKPGDVDLIEVINGVRENEYGSCSSDWGPVRNARRFEPPTEAVAKAIIERRFGMISEIFEA